MTYKKKLPWMQELAVSIPIGKVYVRDKKTNQLVTSYPADWIGKVWNFAIDADLQAIPRKIEQARDLALNLRAEVYDDIPHYRANTKKKAVKPLKHPPGFLIFQVKEYNAQMKVIVVDEFRVTVDGRVIEKEEWQKKE